MGVHWFVWWLSTLSGDLSQVKHLEQSEILRLINQSDKKEKILQYLRGVSYDNEGNITEVKATKIDLISETNITEALHECPSDQCVDDI